ncbi:STM4504/CBY_0614 family protein [Microvirga lenta]|uniref:STM4504/CBY_0614 family protein n=1 Tax=Microvirga lenta TaxID=2881337 RepID=UPI001CFFB702|nr:HEPN domain-containing protein [Microvirga lenta]MCB5176792.1 HEPN domain-containing protein [Microvirga lenta]
MPLVDMYSSRLKAVSGAEDIFQYDSIPEKLRIQVWNIVKAAIGRSYVTRYESYSAEDIYKAVHRAVAHEHGRETLAKTFLPQDADVVERALKAEEDLLVWLDVVELCFRAIERLLSKFDAEDRSNRNIEISASEAVKELNERFRRSGFGYQYESGALVRVDNEYLHRELTKPALALLQDKRFAGANEEFRSAHDHFKNGEFKDCAVDANNALESTMKAICEAKGWTYSKGATAGDLLNVLRNNELIPGYVSGSFQQLINTISSGLPALRNNTGGHGQGAEPIEVPEYVVAYALHLAASKIRFLYEAFRASEAS